MVRHVHPKRRLASKCLAYSSLGFAAIAAQAQTENPPAGAAQDAPLTEIIVTAQRFAEPLSKTPLAISAISGEDLERRNLTSVSELAGTVPSLQVNTYSGRPTTNIRGVGQTLLNTTNNSQVAFNLNGVYVGNATSSSAAFLDLERVEVLRGPQGTLYGRNATAGAINVISAKPTRDLFGYGEVAYGNYESIQTRGVVSGPLGEIVSGRLAFATEQRDGYSLNLRDGRHYDDIDWQTVRGTLAFDFSEDVSLSVIGDYYLQDDRSMATHFFGISSPALNVLPGVVLGGSTVPLDAQGQAIDPRLLSLNTIPAFGFETGGALADLNWKFNDALSFRSLSSWRTANNRFTADYDLTDYPSPDFRNTNEYMQYSQEFQLLGDIGRVKWVTGLYYFYQEVNPNTSIIPFNLTSAAAPNYATLTATGVAKGTAYAAFAQATFAVTDKLSATAGLRYSDERRKGNNLQTVAPSPFPAAGDRKTADFSDVSSKFTLDYHATDELMLYATVSKGFQGGGFAINQQPPLVAFGPEILWNYEVGAKYRNPWLTLNGSAFHYDYSDMQVSQIVNNRPVTVNAANAEVDGLELEGAVRPLHNLELRAAAAYIDSKFTSYSQRDPVTLVTRSLQGNQLPGAVKYSSNVSAAYDIPVLGDNTLALLAQWNWRSRLYFSEFNFDRTSQAPVHTLGGAARFTPRSEAWFVELYGENLTDEVIANNLFLNSTRDGTPVIGSLAPPRTYGIRLHAQFGE